MSVASPLDSTLWYKSRYSIYTTCNVEGMICQDIKQKFVYLFESFWQRCFVFLNCLFVLFVLLTICIAFDVRAGIPQLI